MKRISTLLVILLLLRITAYAQTYIYSGNVQDERTKKPLAFVSVSINGKQQGVQTDIDGKFRLLSQQPEEEFRIAFVGYETRVIRLAAKQDIIVYLSTKAVHIGEAQVIAGENPAHKIIRKAIQNRDHNNPEKFTSFKYVSYNKFIFTGVSDSASLAAADKRLAQADSLDRKKANLNQDSLMELRKKRKEQTDSLLNEQHLFITESVTQREFLFPDFNKENVIASRVSGFKTPQFFLIASQFQSFSFYKDYIKVLDKNYLSPLSLGSTGKYFFAIEDTLYQQQDTVFVISYKPRKDKNFEGLKGILYINSDGYAIQNVIAEPVSPASFKIKVQQQYERTGRYWFPTQLNTDIVFTNMSINNRSMTGIGRSYLRDIEIGIPMERKQFNNISIEYDPKKMGNSDAVLARYRVDTLARKEERTYSVIDSIGKAENFDKKFKMLSILAKGYVPLGYVNLNLNSIFSSYNDYESLRLGLGFNTSDKLSRYFSVGAYGAYGFKDKQFKYGTSLDVPLWRQQQVQLGVSYKDDIAESGATKFRGERSDQFDKYREIAVWNYDKIRQKEVNFTFRSLNYLKTTLFATQTIRTVTSEYIYAADDVTRSQFRLNEYGATFRFAFREKFMRQAEELISLGTKYPVVWLNVIYGEDVLGNAFNPYMKYDLKVQKSFTLRHIGKTSFTLAGGYIDGAVPYPVAYNARANYNGLTGRNAFETMRMNEFLSTEYASLFFIHDFGRLLYSSKLLQPGLSILTNIGYGSLSNKAEHQGLAVKTMEKGYYESGLIVSDLLKMKNNFYTSGLGFGVYYRYGAYANTELRDNLLFKLDLKISF